MLRAFSTAATGMDAQQMMVDTIANNIANVNTNGFKRTQVNFEDLLYVKMQEAGREISSGVIAPSGMEVGSGVKVASTTKIFTPGELQSTGNSLDLSIQGDGFFQVLLPNGEFRYTRDGAFQKDTNGLIVNSSGYQLSPGITIPNDATAVDISLDGTVSAELPTGSQVIGSIQIWRFPNNAGLSAEGGNLFRETGASGTAVAGNPGENGYGTIMSQYLEKSNVEMVNELVNLITAQRAYETNSRCIRVGDDMLREVNQLVR